jgi:hypothetical protein
MTRDASRTRWPILATSAVLAALLGGVVALEAAAPTVGPSVPTVTVVPPGLETAVTCTRADEQSIIDDLRAAFDPDGRITSEIVYACPRAFDGLTVRYVGEVVGDVLTRQGGAWVLVNDDAYALEVGPLGANRTLRGFNSGLSVWLPDGLHEGLGAPGRFGRRGDVVLIDGVLLRADPADGGGITLRATSLEVLSPSLEVTEPLNRALAYAAGGMMLLAIVAMLAVRRRSRRSS